MINVRKWVLISLMAIGSAVYGFNIPAWGMGKGDDAPRMTKDELRSLMEKGEVIILDVRVEDEWKGSKEKIKGAIRENPAAGVKPWAEKYPKDKTIVTYCT